MTKLGPIFVGHRKQNSEQYRALFTYPVNVEILTLFRAQFGVIY